MKDIEKIKEELNITGEKAVRAAAEMVLLSPEKKSVILSAMAKALRDKTEDILAGNAADTAKAKEKNVTSAFLDRLTLTPDRIEDMALGLESLSATEDPIGEILESYKGDQDIEIVKVRVPVGVIGMIYEARPNVTVDAAGICFKTGNAVILRGSLDAVQSNKVIVKTLQEAVENEKGPKNAIQLIEDTSREAARELMRMDKYIDLLIPRGGPELKKTVINESTVPVIGAGIGNCHIFVDASADLDMATAIIINAKTQRPGVCNAVESLLIHKDTAKTFLPIIGDVLIENKVELRACPEAIKYLSDAIIASEEDHATEFLDLIISVKVVDDIGNAIDHINKYGSKHSEAIITNDPANARRFTDETDAAVVFVNASTRFTDGGMFGFGAEIGISTQKLHARGPMGLKEMTAYKYIVRGEGQIRR